MPFATLDDVKRILRISDTNTARDAQLRASLDAIESWASTKTWKIPKEGPNIETYFDIYEDAAIELPGRDVVVTAVKVYEYPSSAGIAISPVSLGLGHGYEITGDGRLLLRPLLDISPFEGAVARRFLRCYSRVEVFYNGSGAVPRALTEGIAFLAAGHWQDGPRALSGLSGEKIGDYSYTLRVRESAVSDNPSFIARAEWMLSPFLKNSRVTVT
jgi:hypothetical protein